MKHFRTDLVPHVVILLLFLTLAGCSTVGHSPAARSPTSATNALRDSHEQLTATLWFQTAAEYHVDCLSKYRAATQYLTRALTNTDWTAAIEQTNAYVSLAPAVIMDLDETVLDNSRFQGQLVLDRTNYTEALWAEWVSQREAAALPGALEFIRQAQKARVKVFFVTNRTAAQEADTRKNLERLGLTLPADEDTILTKGEYGDAGSDKMARRFHVTRHHRVLMIFGDDLGDFITGVRVAPEKRVGMALKYQSFWGERWVLLNNPSYGSWDTSLYSAKDDPAILKEKFNRIRGFK